MSEDLHFSRRILDLVVEIQAAVNRVERKMDAISTDVANLVSAVQSVTTDVTAVLQQIGQAGNLTPQQQQSLEDQITALTNLDTTLKAAITPPAPAPQGRRS